MAEPNIALCLSGGGFRAALFHLGVLRRLHELGILDRVTTISSVSGGSIVAAFLADRIAMAGAMPADDEWEAQIAAPFREFTAYDLRTGPIVRHALWSWCAPGPLARALVKQFRRRLSTRPLSALPSSPRFVFCATDVSFGVNWVFTRDRIGDYQAGYQEPPPEVDLAFAVAASACFPPIFGPLKLPRSARDFAGGAYRGADREAILERLALTDGGVYDNLGLEPALRNHDLAIVSDAGGPFPFASSRTPVLRYMRYPALVMKQVGALRRRQLMARIDDNRWNCELDAPTCRVRAERDGCAHANDPRCKDHHRRPSLRRGVYLGIHSDVGGYAPSGETAVWPGYERTFVKETIAAVRTDLDGFSSGEQKVLENHGYCLAEAGIRRHLRDLAPDPAPAAKPPHEAYLDGSAAATALRRSHRRFSLRRMLGA